MRKVISVETPNDFSKFDDISKWVVSIDERLFIYDDAEELLAEFARGHWWNVRFEYEEE